MDIISIRLVMSGCQPL